MLLNLWSPIMLLNLSIDLSMDLSMDRLSNMMGDHRLSNMMGDHLGKRWPNWYYPSLSNRYCTVCRHLAYSVQPSHWHHGKNLLKSKNDHLLGCLRDQPISGSNPGCKLGKASVQALSTQVKAAGLNLWLHCAGIMRTSHEHHACCHLEGYIHTQVSVGRTGCWQHVYSMQVSCTSYDRKRIFTDELGCLG